MPAKVERAVEGMERKMEGLGMRDYGDQLYLKVGEEFIPYSEGIKEVHLYADDYVVDTIRFEPPAEFTCKLRLCKRSINYILGWRGKGLRRPRRRMLIRALRMVRKG